MKKSVFICQNIVKYQSIKSQVKDVILYVADYLSSIGFSAEILQYDNIPNLYASYGKGRPHLLFAGHLDVVEAGDISSWVSAPFEAKIIDNMLYGRGVADMKGGVSCFLAACEDFIKNKSFQGKISIMLSGDEEEPMVCGLDKMLKTMSERSQRFDFCLVGEPSNPQKIGEQIKIGRRGDIIVNLTSYGQQGHTAYPRQAINPVHNLVTLLHTLQTATIDKGNQFFEPSNLQITTIDVGNPATNIVPATATATLDIRFNSEHTSASIISWIEQSIKTSEGKFDLRYEVVGEAFLSPYNENIKKLEKIITKHTSLTPQLSTSGGTSDARFVKDYCPVVEFGLTNSTIHKVNECEKVSNIELLQEIYFDFLQAYFTS